MFLATTSHREEPTILRQIPCDDRTNGQNHRMKKMLLAVLALLIIAAVAFGVRTLGARDETDKVDAKDAAGLVDQADSDTTIDEGARPEAGTYSYTGSGKETIDALGGSEHVFPTTIAVVITLDAKDDCRWTSNVIYAKQHVEERTYCTDDMGVLDLGFVRKIEFFNQLETKEYTCKDARRLDVDATEGAKSEWRCENGTQATSDYASTLLGMETLTVGGEQVDTWHSRVTSKQAGETVGGDISEFWVAETGLLVRFSADLKVTTASVLGTTKFQEKLDYTLTSLVPKAA